MITDPKELVRHPAFLAALKVSLGSKEAEEFITKGGKSTDTLASMLAMVAGFAAAAGTLAGLRSHLSAVPGTETIDRRAIEAIAAIMFEFGFDNGAEQAMITFPRPDGYRINLNNRVAEDSVRRFEEAAREHKARAH